MVSVLVASYNYERYLGDTIRSVLAQTWGDFELLVIDDGSRDGSVELARSFVAQDDRVRVIRHPDGKNHGLPATLLLGLGEARGRWIAFLESDDLWEPTCLEQRMERARETGADIVFNAIRPLPMPGADTGWFESYVPRVMKEHEQRGKEPFSLHAELLVENKIPTFSCAMVKADSISTCTFEAPVPRWLDWWLWAQIAQDGSFAFLPEKCTLWRIHSGSFNHKISFFRYLRDGSSLWRGFQRILLPACKQRGATREVSFLACPFWMRLVVRFWAIAREEGPIRTIHRILQRIK